jgi:hypothetical protein
MRYRFPIRIPSSESVRFRAIWRRTSGRSASGARANKVSGVTMLATSARVFRPSVFGLYGQSPALIVIEAHSPATELFAKHPILFSRIFNDLQFAVIHPPGDGDQQKPEWVEHSLRIQNPLSRPASRSSEISHLHADPVFGPYAVKVAQEQTMTWTVAQMEWIVSEWPPNPGAVPISLSPGPSSLGEPGSGGRRGGGRGRGAP